MPLSHLAFPAFGLLSIAVGWPLARRRVPPNRWYGLRVPATFADPAIWFDANAVCGEDLVRFDVVLCAVAIGLQFLSGLPEAGYVAMCLSVSFMGAVRATTRGWRHANRLRQASLRSRR